MKKNKIQPLEDEDEEERFLREAAEEAENLIDDDLSKWEPVKVRVARDVKHVYSFRVGAEELDEIVDAAEVAGKDVSAFIREAALREARRQRSDTAVEDVRRKARELTEAVERL